MYKVEFNSILSLEKTMKPVKIPLSFENFLMILPKIGKNALRGELYNTRGKQRCQRQRMKHLNLGSGGLFYGQSIHGNSKNLFLWPFCFSLLTLTIPS
jgi:hypothetical protein